MSVFFCFRNKKNGKYYQAGIEQVKAEAASPKFGDQDSAFQYADERFEGRIAEKARFKDTYEIARIDTRETEED